MVSLSRTLLLLHVLWLLLDTFTALFMAVFSDNEEMFTLEPATYARMNLVLDSGLCT